MEGSLDAYLDLAVGSFLAVLQLPGREGKEGSWEGHKAAVLERRLGKTSAIVSLSAQARGGDCWTRGSVILRWGSYFRRRDCSQTWRRL